MHWQGARKGGSKAEAWHAEPEYDFIDAGRTGAHGKDEQAFSVSPRYSRPLSGIPRIATTELQTFGAVWLGFNLMCVCPRLCDGPSFLTSLSFSLTFWIFLSLPSFYPLAFFSSSYLDQAVGTPYLISNITSHSLPCLLCYGCSSRSVRPPANRLSARKHSSSCFCAFPLSLYLAG